jgi:hypothetical protein
MRVLLSGPRILHGLRRVLINNAVGRPAPQARSAYKMIFWGVAALAGGAVAFPYILLLFN